jgi:hypothetical protein
LSCHTTKDQYLGDNPFLVDPVAFYQLSIAVERRKIMKRFAITVVFSVLSFVCSISQFSTYVSADTDFYLKVENFSWEEFSDNGTSLLKESGPIYALGFSAMSSKREGLTFKGKIEFFGGVVDYDGQTQGGTPVQADTDYYGLDIEGDIGYKFIVLEKASLGPFGGIGLKSWSREFYNLSYGEGYEEIWSNFFARLGFRGDIVSSETMKVFAECGAILPISNRNKVDYFGVTLKPGNEVSAFGEIGLKWKKLKASFFYEGLRFSKSDGETNGYVTFWQPESKADIYGISFGFSY